MEVPLSVGDININPDEFDLARSLGCGQVFRWVLGEDGWYVGTVVSDNGSSVSLSLRQQGGRVEFSSRTDCDVTVIVRTLFRLDVDLKSLNSQWLRAGSSLMNRALERASGLRVMKQDPAECLISFLASSAAPIYRIERALRGVSKAFGQPVGDPSDGQYAFPTLEILADTPRQAFDALGFGYRGPVISRAARQVLDKGGAMWLSTLEGLPYAEAHAELVAINGVGPKIADCVCLFGLAKDEAVPIDVHIHRVAKGIWDDTPQSLTPRSYASIGERFREMFGRHAGWAQQVFYYGQIERGGASDKRL